MYSATKPFNISFYLSYHHVKHSNRSPPTKNIYPFPSGLEDTDHETSTIYAGSHKLWDGMDLDGGLPSGYRLGYWCEVTREARRLVIIRAGVD